MKNVKFAERCSFEVPDEPEEEEENAENDTFVEPDNTTGEFMNFMFLFLFSEIQFCLEPLKI